MNSGQDYTSIPDLWTIWILPYDPFEQNQMIYFVKNVVEDFEEIPYNDGVRKVFLYRGGKLGGSEKLKSLLTYINHSTVENAVDAELQKLHSGVEKLKRNKKIGVKYMRVQDMINWRIQDEVAEIVKEKEKEIREQAEEQAAEIMREKEKELEEQMKKNNQLTSILLQEEKYDDLKHAAEDESYRKELYKRYNIS